MSVNTNSENLDITRDEFDKLSIALQKDEFRKLFIDYCEEIQDPKNRKQYEDEIKQLEAERGVDVTFLNPEPGFVVETSVNGDSKCYLNIAKCDKVAAPSSQPSVHKKNGTKGYNWSIPHGLPPPRHDFDDQKRRCQVFDVMFHPEALFLAEKNSAFKQCLVDTACNGIEREFKVRLDRVNITFPNLKFKGMQRTSIVRKLSETAPLHSNDDLKLIENILPPKPDPIVKKKNYIIKDKHLDEYSKPKYVVKHRHPVDMSEMTYEIDAKMNVTIPKELVVEIELPLLNSATNCTLDITGKKLYFVSEKPAKYKLNVELPYLVKDKDGSAKFVSDKRKLVVTLPVKESNKKRSIQDFYREDSGVESDIREDMSTSSVSNNPPKELELETKKESELCDSSTVSRNHTSFLKNYINYTFPQHFDLNVLDETIAIVLHIRNVNNDSIDLIKGDKFFHIQFSSIGAGYYPAHYAFYFEFVEQSAVQIDSVDAEAWDNNVVLSLNLSNFQNMEYYHAGLNKNNLKLYRIKDEFILSNVKEQKLDDYQSKLEVSVELSDNEKSVQIEIKPRKSNIFNNNCKDEADDELKSNSRCLSKKNRKNKKHRSFSESTCDDIKQENKKAVSAFNNKNIKCNENEQQECNNETNKEKAAGVASSPVVIQNGGGDNIQIPFNRKQRSYSESRNQSAPTFKGILKHSSRYLRNMSDSCSSMEENMSYSCSIDGELKCAHSISDIPEENTSQHSLSESCKKTVRFNDVIKKNIFRLDSSILGRRRLNQKKKNKKRALQRRLSEGDSADYENSKSSKNPECCHKDCENKRNSSKHDSGLDLSTQGKHENACSIRNRIESESSDMDSKNGLMFDIDI